MTAATTPVLDDATFAALWSEHHGEIERYMARRAPAGLADDLTSETFARAWAGRTTYRPELGTAEGWIYGIAARVVADHYRTAARRPATVGEPDLALELAADPTDIAAESADRLLVADALAALTDRQREVLRMRFLEDQTVAVTAEQLGMAAGTVKSTTARALAALKQALLDLAMVVAPISPSATEPGGDPVDPDPAVPDPAPLAPADHVAPGTRRRDRPLRRGPRLLLGRATALAPHRCGHSPGADGPGQGPPLPEFGPVVMRTRIVLLLVGLVAYLIAVWADAVATRDRRMRAWRRSRIRDMSRWRMRRRFWAAVGPARDEMTRIANTITDPHTTSEDPR